MSKELQEQMVGVLNLIRKSNQDLTELSSIDNKLETLIELHREQIEVSNKIFAILELVVDNINKSTDYLESITENTSTD